MAGLLAYQGDIPEYIRRAAQNELEINRAKKAKLPLSVEGSGIPENVRKAAQAALEGNSRYNKPKAAASAGKAIAKAGPLSGLLAVFDGVSELNRMFNPAVRIPAIRKAMDEDESFKKVYGKYQWEFPMGTKKEDLEMLPDAKKAMEYGKGVADRAVDAGLRGILRATKGADAEKEAAQDVALVKSAPPQAEQQRQVVEAGAKEQLRTNQLSRPKAAEAVVRADAARSGQELKPDELKAKVAEETAAMKGMDDDQLSKYISYALIAGGLVASYFDKDAGRAFAQGLNNQLDREQQMSMFEAKQKAAADQAQAKAAQTQEKLELERANVQSQIAAREGNLGIKERELAVSERKADALVDKWSRDSSIAQQRLDAYRERTAKSGSGSDKTPTAPALSQKDNIELVKQYSKAKGVDLDTGVPEAAAQQLMNLQKNYPDLTVDEQMELVFDQFSEVPGEKGILWDSDPKYKLK